MKVGYILLYYISNAHAKYKQSKNLRQVQIFFWHTIFHICHRAETEKEKNDYITPRNRRVSNFST